MNAHIYWFWVLFCACVVSGAPFSEFAVTQNIKSRMPDLDEFGNLVWQQWYQDGTSGDWDIWRKELGGTQPASLVVGWTGNQTAPAVYGKWVVFEDEYAANDHDIYVKDTSSDAEPNALSANAFDEQAPAIHGHTAVWQRLYDDGTIADWDIMGADFSEPGDPRLFNVAAFSANQQTPAIYRTTAVWQDDYWGDWDVSSTDIWLKTEPVEYPVSATLQDQEEAAVWKTTVVWDEDFGNGDFDIMAADMSDPENPRIFFVTEHAAAQINPDIYEHIVVWQDNRNGNWDIYGYNLITRTEFRITDHTANQTGPTVGGGYVAWMDARSGINAIYAALLDGPSVADCAQWPVGDTNSDCRTNLLDLAQLADGWLSCGLEPLTACQD